MKRKESTVLYCNGCRMTTPHAVAVEAHTCKRCGVAKTSDRKKAHGQALPRAEQKGLWN